MRFAARRLTQLAADAKAPIVGDDAMLAAALAHTFQQSHLASKFDLRSFKLHFVEHTADVIVRANGRTTQSADDKKEAEKKKVGAARRHTTGRRSHRTLSSRGSRVFVSFCVLLLPSQVSRFHSWLSKRVSDLAPLAAAQNAAGALGSMLGFGEATYAEGDDAEVPMDTGVDGADGGDGGDGGDAAADEGFGALTAAADADDDGEDDVPVDEEEEDDKMA